MSISVFSTYRADSQDALQLRGAVFYVSMSMWGIKRVESLELSFASVLPSLKLVGEGKMEAH